LKKQVQNKNYILQMGMHDNINHNVQKFLEAWRNAVIKINAYNYTLKT